MLFNGAASEQQSREQTLVQATETLMELQQLQWECMADHCQCGLSPAVFESFIESCRALPVHERVTDSAT
jgi:hypothetical protein